MNTNNKPKIRIEYDQWPPTEIPCHRELADMLRELGSPTIIERGWSSTRMEWPPIYPGVPIPTWTMGEPWPNESPRRRIMKITLVPDPAEMAAQVKLADEARREDRTQRRESNWDDPF